MGITNSGGGGRVGYSNHKIGIHRVFAGQLGAQFLTGGVDQLSGHQAVGPGKVDQFKHAEGLASGATGPGGRMQAVAIDDDDLARIQFSDVLGPDMIQRAGLGCDYPAAVELAQTKRANSQWVAGGNHGVFRLDHDRISPFQLAHALEDSVLPIGAGGVGQQLGDDLCVGRGGESAVPLVLKLVPQLESVDYIAVVGHGQLTVLTINQKRLGIAEFAAAAGGVSGVTDGHVANEGVEIRFSEDLGDQAHVSMDHNVLAIGGGDAGAFLAAVLEGE